LQIIGQIGAFEAPFGGLGATYDVHLRLIGKHVGDFLLVILELFSLGAFVLSQYTRLTDGRTDGQTDRISTAIPCVYASDSRTVKTDALRANIDWKSPFLKGVGHFSPKFQVDGDIPTNHLCTDR